MSETDLVRACLSYLNAVGIPSWRMNTGATKIGDRFIRFGSKGLPDIIGILPGGRFLAIECKVKKRKPTVEQEAFIGLVNESGGLAIVARSVDDVADAIGTVDHP